MEVDTEQAMSDRHLTVWSFVITTTLSFGVLRAILGRFCPVPVSAHNNKRQELTFRNTLLSLLHSLITGVCTVVCFCESPRLTPHMYTGDWPLYLTAFSLGYFIYDLLDLIRCVHVLGTYGLLLHHVIIIIMFTLGLYNEEYLTFAILALFMEINSVFLHIRMLMKLSGVKKSQPNAFRVVCHLNIVTFLVFRMGVFLIYCFNCYVMYERMSALLYLTSLNALAAMSTVNVILLAQLLKSDYILVNVKKTT